MNTMGYTITPHPLTAAQEPDPMAPFEPLTMVLAQLSAMRLYAKKYRDYAYFEAIEDAIWVVSQAIADEAERRAR